MAGTDGTSMKRTRSVTLAFNRLQDTVVLNFTTMNVDDFSTEITAVTVYQWRTLSVINNFVVSEDGFDFYEQFERFSGIQNGVNDGLAISSAIRWLE